MQLRTLLLPPEELLITFINNTNHKLELWHGRPVFSLISISLEHATVHACMHHIPEHTSSCKVDQK